MTSVVYKTALSFELYALFLVDAVRHFGGTHSQAARKRSVLGGCQVVGCESRHTGLFSICCLLFRPFLM